VPSRPARRSEERSKRLARLGRTLDRDVLHPKAVEELEPEFGVVRNGKRQQFLIVFCCRVCGMAASSQVTGIDGHRPGTITGRVSASSTGRRTLDEAAKHLLGLGRR
jgi:hypothetical protein